MKETSRKERVKQVMVNNTDLRGRGRGRGNRIITRDQRVRQSLMP